MAVAPEVRLSATFEASPRTGLPDTPRAARSVVCRQVRLSEALRLARCGRCCRPCPVQGLGLVGDGALNASAAQSALGARVRVWAREAPLWEARSGQRAYGRSGEGIKTSGLAGPKRACSGT